MYVAYLMFRKYGKGERGVRVAAVFGIIAFFNIPFVYFSIQWWRTQHPDPVIMGGIGTGLEPDMKMTLLIFAITFTFLFFYLFQHRMAIENMEDELEAIRRVVAEQEKSRNNVLIENQNFIIEDYTFKEYKKDE
jgi:heme exporter protein C